MSSSVSVCLSVLSLSSGDLEKDPAGVRLHAGSLLTAAVQQVGEITNNFLSTCRNLGLYTFQGEREKRLDFVWDGESEETGGRSPEVVHWITALPF